MGERFPLRLRAALAALGLPFLLSACVVNEPAPAEAAPEPAPPPARDVELNLNLPQPDDCRCVENQTPVDYTFLERGMQALARAEYIEAVQQFQRYQRLEKGDTSRWESDLAIAYVSMLPRSPFYDAEAALEAFTRLQGEYREDMQLNDSIALLYEALDAFLAQARHLQDLENSNAILREDLEKREQALKRLRELTLGQQGGQR
jgi:hypothetical protein